MSAVRICLVAGEPSGDALGAQLIRALRARIPDAQCVGIGGPRMIAAGLDCWHPQEALAVRGLVEVLRHLRRILKIRRALLQRLASEPVDVYVGIDAPDFNLPVERVLKARGTPTVHYVGPTVWSWRRGRLPGIRQSVTRMLVLFPFEQQVFEQAGIATRFVGHPLAEAQPPTATRAAAREQLRLTESAPVFALLPGSRRSEIEMMAPALIDAARRIHAARPDSLFLVPVITRETRDVFEACIWRMDARDLPLRLLFGHAREALAAADIGLVTSGTATLEAALLGCAMVITYRLSPLTFAILKRLARARAIGLPNILLGEFVVPELIQNEATGANLAQVALNLLADPALRVRLGGRFEVLRQMLYRDSDHLAASAVIECLPAPR